MIPKTINIHHKYNKNIMTVHKIEGSAFSPDNRVSEKIYKEYCNYCSQEQEQSNTHTLC